MLSIANQVSSNFDYRELTARLLKKDTDTVMQLLKSHYRSNFSQTVISKHVHLWNDIAHDIFPNCTDGDLILTPEEDEFITNFLVPWSGNPKESIAPELLAESPALKGVFERHTTLADKIKDSTFSQQRISYHQISPSGIEI